MNRFKTFFSSLVMILFMSSQALADREGYSDEGDGIALLILLIFGLVVGAFIILLAMASDKS